MNAPDRVEFMEALAPLFSAYGKPLGEEQADAYWRYLRDLPLQTVLDGIEAAGRKAGRYLPSVGQIREAIDEKGGAYGGVRDTRSRVECDACDGTGWQQTEIPHPRGYMVPAVRQCSCAAGVTKRGGRQLEGAA